MKNRHKNTEYQRLTKVSKNTHKEYPRVITPKITKYTQREKRVDQNNKDEQRIPQGNKN